MKRSRPADELPPPSGESPPQGDDLEPDVIADGVAAMVIESEVDRYFPDSLIERIRDTWIHVQRQVVKDSATKLGLKIDMFNSLRIDPVTMMEMKSEQYIPACLSVPGQHGFFSLFDRTTQLDSIVEQLEGTKVVREILKLLDCFYIYTPGTGKEQFERTGYQREAQWAIVVSAFYKIYGGADFKAYRKLILEYWNVPESDYSERVIIMWDRRRGKTISTGSVDATLLFCLQAFKLIIVSLAMRQSTLMMKENIMPFLLQIPGARERIVKQNQEILQLSRTGDANDPMKTSAWSLPGGSKIRGITADKLTVDEGGHIDQAMIFDQVGPLMRVEGTSCTMISSVPTDPSHIFFQLTEMTTEDGKPFCKVLKLVNKCEDCKKNNVATCPHVQVEESKWISAASHDDMKMLYKENQAALNREILNLMVTEEVPAFAGDWITRLRATPPVTLKAASSHVFISVDPAAGGPSDTAWVTMCFDEYKNLVVSFLWV